MNASGDLVALLVEVRGLLAELVARLPPAQASAPALGELRSPMGAPGRDAPERLLTPQEVGEALGLRADTVRHMIRAGEMRSLKFGRLVRVRESVLREYLEAARRGEVATTNGGSHR
jgi:excisionase family DNA binding protein